MNASAHYRETLGSALLCSFLTARQKEIVRRRRKEKETRQTRSTIYSLTDALNWQLINVFKRLDKTLVK